MIESGPHILRLIALPAFAWAAWTDYHTRRVDPRLWPILIGVGIGASLWQITQLAPLRTADELETLLRIVVAPPAIGVFVASIYNLGHLGGADVKAIFTISLLFPATAVLPIPILSTTLPLYENPYRIAAISIIMNGMVVAVFYPIIMWVNNFKRGDLSLETIDSELKRPSELEQTAGQMRFSVGEETHIVDLDTLRMYLRWRGINIETVKQNSDTLMDPKTVTETHTVNNGAIRSGWKKDHILATSYFDDNKTINITDPDIDEDRTFSPSDDPWAAEQFLESIDHDGYGTKPESLSLGLTHIVESNTVRVLPAYPLVVPLFAGLVITLTIGDIATAWIHTFMG